MWPILFENIVITVVFVIFVVGILAIAAAVFITLARLLLQWCKDKIRPAVPATVAAVAFQKE